MSYNGVTFSKWCNDSQPCLFLKSMKQSKECIDNTLMEDMTNEFLQNELDRCNRCRLKLFICLCNNYSVFRRFWKFILLK